MHLPLIAATPLAITQTTLAVVGIIYLFTTVKDKVTKKLKKKLIVAPFVISTATAKETQIAAAPLPNTEMAIEAKSDVEQIEVQPLDAMELSEIQTEIEAQDADLPELQQQTAAVAQAIADNVHEKLSLLAELLAAEEVEDAILANMLEQCLAYNINNRNAIELCQFELEQLRADLLLDFCQNSSLAETNENYKELLVSLKQAYSDYFTAAENLDLPEQVATPEFDAIDAEETLSEENPQEAKPIILIQDTEHSYSFIHQKLNQKVH